MTTNQQPKVSQREFFNQPEVKALQEIQKRNPYGSKAHREAFEKLAAMAQAIGVDFGAY